MNIYEVLDYFNETVDYVGLDNKNKKTDDRDDVISRQAFNNWKSEFNNFIKSGIITGTEIKAHYHQKSKEHRYFKTDVDRIIKHFKPRLVEEYYRKTIAISDNPELKAFGLKAKDDDKTRIAKTRLNYIHFSNETDEDVRENIEEMKKRIIESFIDMEKVEEDAIQLILNGVTEYEIDDYIKSNVQNT